MENETLARILPKMEAAAAPYTRRSAALLAVLHAVQDEMGFVPSGAEKEVADFLGVPPARVHEALSFYTLFRRKPPARFRIQVCRTLTCAVCGEADLQAVLHERLGVTYGGTTADGMFSVEAVECLGACEKAPALRVNDGSAQGPFDAGSLAAFLDSLRRSAEGGNAG